MLRQLKLRNFRSFRDFTVSFGDGAYLVGPNNAGKSTILTALRIADVLLRYAQRRNPTDRRMHKDRYHTAYPVSLPEFPALLESVRHEFSREETFLELTWKSGSQLTAVWPKLDDAGEDSEFFYLERQPGLEVRSVAVARSAFTALGVIPVLGPVEHSEEVSGHV